ncbi:hypothetical protein SASPL_107146 [Salvia splendens]|uniref:Cupin type-1 domain-containing protein n=1 Tax=Salvia splendens TaxID=180675 RepID=A0A8X9A459_SALSN|nr:hypothetical protein SASPL_107146 [Salvia splendens]
MATTFLSALSLALLLSSASAYKGGSWQQGECDITRINAMEPSFRLQSGITMPMTSSAPASPCTATPSAPEVFFSLSTTMLPCLSMFFKWYLWSDDFWVPKQSPDQGMRSQNFGDRHQQIGFLKQGDVVAIRAGDAHWAYNNGDQDLLVVSFFLAGKPNWGQEQQKEQLHFHGERRREQKQHEFGNVFKGMSVERLAEVFEVIKPPLGERETESSREYNGIDETICSTKNKNAIMAPHWLTNAHSILYITRGDKFIQVVNHKGQVREGQVLVVPQNFAVLKQAGEQGCEWVEFQTNANAMINTLSGRTSALRGLPVDVVANAYQISREEAETIKNSRREALLFSASRPSTRRVASA